MRRYNIGNQSKKTEGAARYNIGSVLEQEIIAKKIERMERCNIGSFLEQKVRAKEAERAGRFNLHTTRAFYDRIITQ